MGIGCVAFSCSSTLSIPLGQSHWPVDWDFYITVRDRFDLPLYNRPATQPDTDPTIQLWNMILQLWLAECCLWDGRRAGWAAGGWTDEQTDRQTDTGLLALNWIIWTSPEFPSSNPDQIGTQLLPYRPPAVCATVSNWYTQTRTKGRHTQYPISCLMSTLSSFAVKLLHLSEQI